MQIKFKLFFETPTAGICRKYEKFAHWQQCTFKFHTDLRALEVFNRVSKYSSRTYELTEDLILYYFCSFI